MLKNISLKNLYGNILYVGGSGPGNFTSIQDAVNNASEGDTVFVFDEVDKLEDLDFLYTILEEIYKKTVLLITNYKEWII